MARKHDTLLRILAFALLIPGVIACTEEDPGGGSDTTLTDTSTGSDTSTPECGPDPSATCTSDSECDTGNVCRPATCVPSTCSCDETTGTWGCTADCGMGMSTCIPEGSLPTCTSDADCTEGSEWCEDGECVACDNTGQLCDLACVEGSSMVTRNGCTPCACQPDNACTSDADCDSANGELCAPGDVCLTWCEAGDPSCCYGNTCETGSGTTCTSDSDCTSGEEWCEGGLCVTCDNSGPACFIDCPEGTDLYQRNGCSPCECKPTSACASDGDCASGEICQAGGECLFWCPDGDPSCCYGNTCTAP